MRASHVGIVIVGGLLWVGCGASPTRPSDALTSSGASGVSRHAEAVPFKGRLDGSQAVTPLEPPFIFVDGRAEGTATHLGTFTVTFPHRVNFVQATGTGTYTFTAANGDTLIADFTGKAVIGEVTSIEEEAVITGGTGRFAGSTGQFTARRIFNPATGVTTGSFEGTVTSPGAGHH